MNRQEELYNPELKNAFLEYRVNTQGISTDFSDQIRHSFATMAPREFELDKDICLMDPEELSSAVKLLYSTKDATNRGRLSHIRKYCEWCIRKGVPGAVNVVNQVRVEVLDKFQKGHIPSPLALKRYLDVAIPLSEKPSISEVRPRVVLWLSFAGLGFDQINTLKTSEVDLENLKILKVFPIYPEALQDFRYCMQSWFWYDRSDINPYRQRQDGDLFLRGFRGPVNAVEICREARKKFFAPAVEDGKVQYLINSTNLRSDGIYYRLYQEEISLGSIDKKYIRSFAAKISEEKLETTITDREIRQSERSSSAQHVRNNILKEYPLWKDAFGL